MELDTVSVTQSPPSVCKSLLSHENDFAKVCPLIKPNFFVLWRGRGGRQEGRGGGKEGKGGVKATENNKHLKEEEKLTAANKYLSLPTLLCSLFFPSLLLLFQVLKDPFPSFHFLL